MRVFFATFNSSQGVDTEAYNSENCKMVSDLLNENVKRLNNGEMPARFWCEKGIYKE